MEQARIAKGITLEQIEEATRISAHFLEAIEQEDFGELPGGVYNTSYLRQYARAVGFDESALLQYYFASTAPVTEVEQAPAMFRVHDALKNVFQFVTTGRRSQHAA
jgi:cytoskeletal protein RodZ